MKTLLSSALLIAAGAFAQAPDAGPPAAPAAAASGANGGLELDVMPFTSETVKKVVAHNREKIQACYEEMLAGKDKPVEGRVMTSFVVTPEGLVKKARVVSKGTTLKDPKLHACVVDALGTFTFPRPSDRRDHPVEYPFNLKAVR